jgi:hypothetical protein
MDLLVQIPASAETCGEAARSPASTSCGWAVSSSVAMLLSAIWTTSLALVGSTA